MDITIAEFEQKKAMSKNSSKIDQICIAVKIQSEIHGINNTIQNLANFNPVSDENKCDSTLMLTEEN